MATTARSQYENHPFQPMQASHRERQHSGTQMPAGKHESGSWQSRYAGRQYVPYGNSIAQFDKYRKEH